MPVDDGDIDVEGINNEIDYGQPVPRGLCAEIFLSVCGNLPICVRKSWWSKKRVIILATFSLCAVIFSWEPLF